VAAVLSEPGGGSQVLTLFVATYSANPQPDPLNGLAFHDVRATGVDAAGRLVVTFHFSGGNGQPVVLEFFDQDTGHYQPVVGSRLAPQSVIVDLTGETVTVVFDASSFPALTALSGTVFTIALTASVQSEATLTPSLALALTSSQTANQSFSQQVTFQTSNQLTLTLTPSQDVALSAGTASLSGGSDEPDSVSDKSTLSRILGQVFFDLPGLIKPLLNSEEIKQLLQEVPAKLESPPPPVPSPTPETKDQSRLDLIDDLFSGDWLEEVAVESLVAEASV
jgi:hypothetical protein